MVSIQGLSGLFQIASGFSDTEEWLLFDVMWQVVAHALHTSGGAAPEFCVSNVRAQKIKTSTFERAARSRHNCCRIAVLFSASLVVLKPLSELQNFIELEIAGAAALPLGNLNCIIITFICSEVY